MGIGLRLWRWTLFCRFNSPSFCSYHISVSGAVLVNYRRVLEKKVKRYERRSTNSNGAIKNPQLKLLVMQPVFIGAFRRSRAQPQHQTKIADFLKIISLRR
jgi:hypothetical protein